MKELAIDSEVGEVRLFSSSASFLSFYDVPWSAAWALCFLLGEMPDFLLGETPIVCPIPFLAGLAAPKTSFCPGIRVAALTFK
jgi:hypothetical protein